MSGEQQPELKRKRVDESADRSSPPVEPVRSSIWYDDGNVILQAGAMQFRVHKGILAQSSSVFSDMLSFPQPATANVEMIDECPVVRLSDSAEEVEYVLQALCQRKYVAFGETVGDKLPFGVVSAFLCLGQKYDIRSLYVEAQRRLFREFPATLAAEDALEDWTAIDGPHYMDLVVLARKTGLLSILPRVLYGCIRNHSVDVIIDGERVDGCLKSLPIQDQVTCLAGIQGIYQAPIDTTFQWLWDTTKSLAVDCAQPKRCIKGLQKICSDLFTPAPAVYGYDKWVSDYSDVLCSKCTKIWMERHEEGRKDFWEGLPGLFRLPPWTELLKEREGMYVFNTSASRRALTNHM
ncbi:hypothetical protein FIBSPDRAFT_835408 [Athelia psychrophila]|uniref:BTB domain-containing protein n=1 Tax=Athelia psychrophila TaxID=1759441 RepID=A0A166BZ39_9AGAM|nr:hypothetical protein FIBSPDRAFT_835408 [Fibularhizoctonia sp. CBS 109695]